VLEISNTTNAMLSLDDEDHRVAKPSDCEGLPNRGAIIINESGLYSLILKSRKPEAKAFKKWVTSEVLPSIRKTGMYLAPKVGFPHVRA
jgi:anti-repressor protein